MHPKPCVVIHTPIIADRLYASSHESSEMGPELFCGAITEKKNLRQLKKAMLFVQQKFTETGLYIYGLYVTMQLNRHFY